MIKLLIIFLFISCNANKGGNSSSSKSIGPSDEVTPEADLSYPVSSLTNGTYKTSCEDQYTQGEQYELIVSNTNVSVVQVIYSTRTCDTGTHVVMRSQIFTDELIFSQSFNQVRYLVDQVCGGTTSTFQIDNIGCEHSWEGVVLEFYEIENGYQLDDLIFTEV